MNAVPRKKMTSEIKAGIFIACGLALVMCAILLLGGGDALFNKYYRLKARFDDVSGLSSGSYVRSGGISVGRVVEIEFDNGYKNILVTMLIREKYSKRIHKDSKVQMLTQGVLGDKYIEILDGSSESPVAVNDDILETKGPEGITQMLKGGENVIHLLESNLKNIKKITDSFAADRKSDDFFKNLTDASRNMNELVTALNQGKTTKELSGFLKNLRVLTDRINNGEGTVGALLNDSSLYEDLKLLIGGASRNRVLQFFVKQAVKSSDDHKKETKESTPPTPSANASKK